MQLENLWASLRHGRVSAAISTLHPWLDAASPGDVELLLHACPPRVKHHLALLAGDLMSHYPHTLVGVPVQIFGVSGSDSPQGLRRIEMPERPTNPEPCPGLVFVGWLHKDSLLPVRMPPPVGAAGVLELGTVDCKVAIFISEPGLDSENIIIPPVWWSDLFACCGANIYLSAQSMHPYPQALEVARALNAAAHRQTFTVEPVFASQLTVDWAAKAGVLFVEQGTNIPGFSLPGLAGVSEAEPSQSLGDELI